MRTNSTPAGGCEGGKGQGERFKYFASTEYSDRISELKCMCLSSAAVILHIESRSRLCLHLFLLCLCFFHEDTSLSVSLAVLSPPTVALSRSLSLALSLSVLLLSLSPPIPSLSTPLTLPVPSSYPASQVTMTGGFLAPISWSFSARLCVTGCACAYVFMSVCLPSVLSRVLVPASWQRGATQQPVCDWAGEWGS